MWEASLHGHDWLSLPWQLLEGKSSLSCTHCCVFMAHEGKLKLKHILKKIIIVCAQAWTKNLTLPNQFYYYYYFYRQTYDMFNGQYNLRPPLRFSRIEKASLVGTQHLQHLLTWMTRDERWLKLHHQLLLLPSRTQKVNKNSVNAQLMCVWGGEYCFR